MQLVFMVAAALIGAAATAQTTPAPTEPAPYDVAGITADVDSQVAEMIGLYRDACFAAFPDDKAAAAAMARRGARPLDEAGVKRFLHDDAGIAWVLPAKGGACFHVTIELPPFHACSVRTVARTDLGETAAYRGFVEQAEKDWGPAVTSG